MPLYSNIRDGGCRDSTHDHTPYEVWPCPACHCEEMSHKHAEGRTDCFGPYEPEQRSLEVETTAEVGVLIPKKHNFFSGFHSSVDPSIVYRRLVGPSIDVESILAVEEQKVVSLASWVQKLTFMESHARITLRKMSKAFLWLQSSGDTRAFDALWSQWCDEGDGMFWLDRHDPELCHRLDRPNRMRTTLNSSRSGHLLFAFKNIEIIGEQLRFMRSLLPQAQQKLQNVAKETEKRRKESACARIEAMVQGRREDTAARQRYRRSVLAEDPKQKRQRLAEEMAAKVLECMAILNQSRGPLQLNEAHPVEASCFKFLPQPLAIRKRLPARSCLDLDISNETSKCSQNPRLPSGTAPLYSKLNLSVREVRLLEFKKEEKTSIINLGLHTVLIDACPPYTALSYRWGDGAKRKSIKVNGHLITVRENLWWFLHTVEAGQIDTRYLWIDALCIDQGNVHERNHQVRMMKNIYQQATNVIVWLGKESDDSDLAIEYIAEKGLDPLKSRANGYHQMWTNEQGKALLSLCERNYWRRIWIVQEIIHAQTITVRCGQKTFPWRAIENTYYKLKVIESEGYYYQRLHPFSAHVLNSAACTMVWQRAQWRHPDTPTPTMLQLVRVFRDWQCSDLRDKVNALNGLVVPKTSIVIEYESSLQQVFDAVRNAAPEWDEADDTLMREVLGIPYPCFQRDELTELCGRRTRYDELSELRYNPHATRALPDGSRRVVMHEFHKSNRGPLETIGP